jgi:hypothetical protein
MKKILGLLFLMLNLTAFSQDGKLKRDLTSFSAVNVKGNIDLIYMNAKEYYVELVGKDASDVVTTVEDDVLHVYHKKAKNWVASEWNTLGKGLQVIVHAPSVNSLESAGSGNIQIDGVLKTEQLSIRMDGAGNVLGQINVGKLHVENNGSSNIRLKGGVDNAVINSNGSGNIQCFDLVVDKCTLSKSGSGNAQLTVNVSLQASISGSGNFTYRGNPKEISTSSAGIGKIKRDN